MGDAGGAANATGVSVRGIRFICGSFFPRVTLNSGLGSAKAGERHIHDFAGPQAERAAGQVHLAITEPTGLRVLLFFQRHIRFVTIGFLLFCLVVG